MPGYDNIVLQTIMFTQTETYVHVPANHISLSATFKQYMLIYNILFLHKMTSFGIQVSSTNMEPGGNLN